MSDVEEKAIAEEHARKASQRAYREELIEWNRDAKAKTDLAERDDETITKKAEDVMRWSNKSGIKTHSDKIRGC